MSTPIAPGAAHATQVNSGAYTGAVYAIDAATATAGAGSDGAFVDGEAYDRLATRALALSAKLVVPYTATQASGESTVVRGRVQHRALPADDWEDYDDEPSDVTVAALDSGNAVEGVAEFNFDLAGAKRYVRFRMRPTLSASGTDTFAHGRSVAVLGGYDNLPVE